MSNANDVGSISEDGNWIWDGQQWQAYQKTEPEISAPAMDTNEEFIQTTEKEFDTIDKNNDGVIDREEYIAKIMEDTLKKKEAEKAPDQIMKIMTIFILIFASCTGFISQKVSSIEAEAGELDAAADLKIADARAEESKENQLLIKEEILLTEAQNLVLEIENYENQISQLENSINQTIEQYLEPAVQKELLEYVTYGYVIPSEYGILPLENCLVFNVTQCKVELYATPGEEYTQVGLLINYTADGESLVDLAFETLANDGQGEAYKEELENSVHYLMDIQLWTYNSSNFLLDQSEGLGGDKGQLFYEMFKLQEIEYRLIDLGTDLDFVERSMDYYNNKQIIFNQESNSYGLKAELALLAGDTNGYNENISLQDEYRDFANEMEGLSDENYTLWTELRNKILENNSLIVPQTESIELLEKKLDNTEDQMLELTNEMTSSLDELFTNYSELESLSLSLSSAESLKSSLLNRSAAYQNGAIDNQTGMYISDEEQNSFTEEVHANSDAKYESAQKDQQDAQEMNDKLTSVSSSVLFISVANMLLGIAGGFATKKEKKKNAMILLVAGAVSGVIGAIQIVPLI